MGPPWPRRELAVSMAGEGGPPSSSLRRRRAPSSRPPPTWPWADPAARHVREGEEGEGAPVWTRHGRRGSSPSPWPGREARRRARSLRRRRAWSSQRGHRGEGWRGSSATGEGRWWGGRGPPACGQRSSAPPCRPRRRVRRPWARLCGPNPSVVRPLLCFVLASAACGPWIPRFELGAAEHVVVLVCQPVNGTVLLESLCNSCCFPFWGNFATRSSQGMENAIFAGEHYKNV